MSTILSEKKTLSPWAKGGIGLGAGALLLVLVGFYAPPAPGLLPLVGMILLDYVLAFTLLGLACAIAKPFSNKLVGVGVGTAVVCFIRFMCSFLSGVLVWGNLNDGLAAWTYSLTYNGSYMLPETLLTMVAAVLLCRVPPLPARRPIPAAWRPRSTARRFPRTKSRAWSRASAPK